MPSSTDSPTRSRRIHLAAPLALCLGFLFTLGATLNIAQTSYARDSLRFRNDVSQAHAAIDERLEVQISLLRSTAGLFAASKEVTLAEFHTFVSSLDLANNYPGVQGVGFSVRLRPEERETFVTHMHAMGQENFQIWPEGDRAEYHTIAMLEPLDRRNRAAIGYDMSTETTRYEAMQRARDMSQPTASGRVILVQEIDQAKQPGFLIYVPIYRGGVTPATVDARREYLVGFAYSPFRSGDLFSGIFGNQDAAAISFDIYDGTELKPEALLYHSESNTDPRYQPRFTSNETFMIAERQWTIVYHSLPAFDRAGTLNLVPVILLVGSLLSMFLFFLVQAQVNARHQAEQAVHERDIFLSVASHELKTPLTALYGNIQLLQRRVANSGSMSEREQRITRAVVEQTRRLMRLIDGLLDRTRLQEGRLNLELEPIDLGALAEQVVDEVQPTLVQHSLVLHRPNEPLMLIGDTIRMEQVFFNLIGNAIKYSPYGGLVEVKLRHADTTALIQVTDHGLGIPSEVTPQLFQQFYRAPNAINRQIRGMGIGLYVVKEIVERHGGTVTVESAEGQGSTFSVRLPLAEGAACAESC